MKVGIFDSGLGGLTVLRAIHRRSPHAELIYLGDTARTPYGSKGAETIKRYARECASFLVRHEIDVLVVACNTASALALDILEEFCPCPVIGTIEPAVRACLKAHVGGAIGVIGTNATIASGVYPHALLRERNDIEVISQSCPLFVPLVEEGMLEGEVVDKVVEHHLSDLKGKVGSLILACTHYPLLKSAIQRYLGSDVVIRDCAESIASVLGNDAQAGINGGSEPRFFVTDAVSRFNRLAALLLDGMPVNAIGLEDLKGRPTRPSF